MPAVTLNLAEALLAPALDGGRGDRDALICDEGTFSYRDLEAEAARHADALRASGIVRDDRVVIALPDGSELVAAFLGALAAGAVPVVVNTRLDDDALAYVLADSGARVFFAEAGRLAACPALGEAGELAAAVAVDGEAPGAATYSDWLDGRRRSLHVEATGAQDMAYWLYTSGTTGRPKAVVHRHGDVAVSNLHLTRNLGLVPGERILTTSKLFFAYALAHSLIGALHTAATVVLHRGWPEAHDIARLVDATRPDIMLSVPTFYRRLIDAGHGHEPGFTGVRHYVSAGEPLPVPLAERWERACGHPILEGIGTTETTWLFVANTPSSRRPGSTGRVLPWAEARLVGEDGDEVSGPGQPGVLWVRMGSMFTGYWNQPERTRAVRDGDWYRTDDLFERDAEGFLYYRGRRGEMFKVSGQWVSLMDVEHAALELDCVDDAAAIAREDEHGLAGVVLCAVPHEREADAALAEHIITELRARLPHHQCPRAVRFVEGIPRTATGKIRRFELDG